MRNRPAGIRERINDFRSALSNVTDSIVNVDAFEIHDQDSTKTDVLLHFVNPRDNSVMEVPEILRIIDYKTEQLDPLFREFNVLHTVRLITILKGSLPSRKYILGYETKRENGKTDLPST